MNRLHVFILSIISIITLAGCGSPSESTDAAQESSSTETVEVDTSEEENAAETEEPEFPFNVEDFVLEITPNGQIDSAGGVEYAYTIQNNSEIPVQEFSADVKLEFEDGQTMVENIAMYTTIMDGETTGNSGQTTYPEPASKIKSYEVIAYQILDPDGIYYDVDLQLGTVESYEYGTNYVSDNIDFAIDEFVITVTPNGNIDSAGGVEYAYEIQNNSSIPVQDISFDVKMEFENGQTLVETISVYDTLMNGDAVGNSGQTTYPEPADKIKFYQVIGYQLTDKDSIYYDVDTQLELVEAYSY